MRWEGKADMAGGCVPHRRRIRRARRREDVDFRHRLPAQRCRLRRLRRHGRATSSNWTSTSIAFAESCAGFYLTNPYSKDETARLLAECVRRAGVDDASYIHLHVTRGPLSGRVARSPALRQSIRLLRRPLRLAVGRGEVEGRRSICILPDTERISSKAVDARYKNFHWADLIHSQYEAYAAGRDDSVLCGPDGNLAEGPGYNIWVVKKGVCATPDAKLPARHVAQVGDRALRDGRDPLRGPFGSPRRAAQCRRSLRDLVCGRHPAGDGNRRQTPRQTAPPGILTSRLMNSYWRKREEGWCGTRIDDLLAA